MSGEFEAWWRKFWGSTIGLVLFLIIWAVMKYMGWQLPRW
jgi:hypothetical protein